MADATKLPPLAIIGQHDGITGIRFRFSDHSHTVVTDDGRVICISRRCIDARSSGDCEHTSLVRERLVELAQRASA